MHMVAALHSYTHPTWLRLWSSGSLVESKRCDYVMFEADGHLKLLPRSILDIHTVHWHMIAALHSLPTVICSDFGVLGHLWLWSQNDVIMSLLKLTALSNCFPHPSKTFTKCLSTLICCPYALSIGIQ
jgi:hypothetical protein